MCLLTVFPMPGLENSKLEERLYNGAQSNDDGHGWAVIQGKRILTYKAMNKDEAIETFLEAYDQATGPAIFHSRWATHGTKNLANVHPFPVRKLADTYVAHNGIMPDEALPAKWDKRSDTRVFADDILPIKYRRLDSPKVQNALSTWLRGNKIAVLTTNPHFKRQLYVFGLGLGEFVDGVWYSNGDYEGWHRWLRHSDKDEECIWCHAKNVNAWDYCETCGTCQDCFEPMDECQCMIPSKGRYADLVDADDADEPSFDFSVSSRPLALESRSVDDFPCVIGYDPATRTERAVSQAWGVPE